MGNLGKVTWPTRKDTSAMTTVTCVMLIIAGVGLFFLTLFLPNWLQHCCNLNFKDYKAARSEKKWYIVNTQTGCEATAKASIERRWNQREWLIILAKF